MNQTLKSTLVECRKLRALIESNVREKGKLQLQLLMLLVELKGQSLLWVQDYKTWDLFLRAEKVVSRSTYYRFETALRLLSLEDVQRFGVSAASTLVMAPKEYRGKLIKQTRQWYGKHGTPKPSHEKVSQYVWHKRRDLAPKSEFISRGRLLGYIEKLKKKLRDNGIRPPSIR